MTLVSFKFFCFLAAALLVYYLTPQRFRWAALLAASCAFFIITANYIHFLFAVAMTAIAWFGAYKISRVNEFLGRASGDEKNKLLFKKKVYVRGTVAVLVVILVILVENAFFIITINWASSLLRHPLNLPLPKLMHPLGISYYTLILVGYVLQVAWKKCPVEKNPLRLLLFSTYFPQITSGPFTRYGDMRETLFTGHRFDYQNFCFGLQRFVWGLFKKLVISERLFTLSRTVFGDYSYYNGLYIPLALIISWFYSYSDFSACMDIVIGASQMFGVRLPENFNTPLYSRNYGEVWRRWHITLGAWFRDFVMYPFMLSKGTKRLRAGLEKVVGKKTAETLYVFPGMFLVWTCFGMWHGGTPKFFFRGVVIFVIIAGGMLLGPVFQKIAKLLRINTEAFSWVLFQRIRTFLIMTMSGAVFAMPNLREGFKFVRSAFDIFNPWIFFDGSLYKMGLDRWDFWCAMFGLSVFFLVSHLQQRGSVREMIARQNLAFRWAVYLALAFAVLVLGKYGPGYDPKTFVYAGF